MTKKNLFCFLILLLSIIFYYFTLSIKGTVFVDTWPLHNVVFETSLLLLLISLLSKSVFKVSRATIIFVYSIIIIMYIYIPLFKYHNDLLLYGPWDSSAHYSFTLWISEKGYVPANNELGYSIGYGRHPGNGLLPAILGIVGQISPLPLSMSIVLWISYMTYALLLLTLAVPPGTLGKTKFASIIALLALFTLYPPYYGGVELCYAFVALIAYFIVGTSSLRNQIAMPQILLMVITYFALLICHFSTAVIILFFLVSTLTCFLVFKKYFTLFLKNRKLIDIILVIGILFLAYELYVDIYLAELTFINGIKRLIDLYIGELETVRRTLEYNPYVSLNDLITFLVSQYAKTIVIMISIGIYILYRLYIMKKLRADFSTNGESIAFALLVLSLPSWLIGWFGVGNFLSGGRALPLIQFFFSVSIIRSLNKNRLYRTQGYIRRFVVSSFLIMLFLFGFFSNFSVHIGPYITSLEGERYTYSVWTQGAISPFVLDTVSFLNRFLTEDSDCRFLCVQPYISFGLCDLVWNKPKIPTHSFVRPKPTTPDAMIELLNGYTSIVIPMPTSDKIVPGPLGYVSLYYGPFSYILAHGRGVIYSNEYYTLTIK